jgi:hypothetical protein
MLLPILLQLWVVLSKAELVSSHQKSEEQKQVLH